MLSVEQERALARETIRQAEQAMLDHSHDQTAFERHRTERAAAQAVLDRLAWRERAEVEQQEREQQEANRLDVEGAVGAAHEALAEAQQVAGSVEQLVGQLVALAGRLGVLHRTVQRGFGRELWAIQTGMASRGTVPSHLPVAMDLAVRLVRLGMELGRLGAHRSDEIRLRAEQRREL